MDKNAMVTYLIGELKKENLELHDLVIPDTLEEKERLLRALFNTRKPMAASTQFLTIQDLYLQVKKGERGIVHLDDLQPIDSEKSLYLWQGDITRLEVDAMVNAANQTLLGCMQPLHDCVDNAIHTYSGVQLRQACYELMLDQNYPEPVGLAKITPAYNLPSAFVVHTVGPTIKDQPTTIEKELLSSSYLSSLALAEKNGMQSIAFPAISTGVFNFPKEEAAQIAVATVKAFLKTSQHLKHVIFAVYDDQTYQIYQNLLLT